MYHWKKKELNIFYLAHVIKGLGVFQEIWKQAAV